ncbi:MAG: hypothetical protein U0575_13480 [Phycisphaerales bacterium]|jgi:hypothetical protein
MRRALPIAACFLLAACYRPQGSLMPSSTDPFTYISLETFEQTLTLVDVRTNKPIFVQAIPPGQQLTLQFLEGGGDDPVLRPDRMVFQLQPVGTMTGKLENQISVPAVGARRIDVDVQQNVKYRVPMGDARYVPPQGATTGPTSTDTSGGAPSATPGGMYDR